MPKDRQTTLANSFPMREVNALLELHACIMRGGDPRQIAKSPEVCNVIRKFRAMHARGVAAGAGAGAGDDEAVS